MPLPRAVQAAQLSPAEFPPERGGKSVLAISDTKLRLLAPIIFVQIEPAILIFHHSMTFRTESHFGGVFAARRAQYPTIG